MSSKEGARRIFIVLILIALGLIFLLVRPFGQGLVFAMVLAATLSPLHRRLTARLAGRESISAGLLCAAVLLLMVMPLGGLGAFIVGETIQGVRFVNEAIQSEGMNSLLGRLPDIAEAPVRGLLGTVVQDPANWDEDLKRHATEHGNHVAQFMSKALAMTGNALLQVTLSLIALFFFLLDGPKLVDWIEKNSPLMRGQVREMLTEFRGVSTAVLVSSLVTAGVQALAALAGYFIAGVPQALFFGLVTFVVAFVPAVGAGGVCLVASLLMFAVGKAWAGIFLAVWVIPVGLVDNFVKPLLVQRGMHMHGGVVFFALIGGIAAFGAVGLLLGPLVVTFFLALVRIYRRDFVLEGQSENEAEQQE